MDEVKRKVYLDLFASPTTLLPVVGGLTLLLASWAAGGNGLFNFAGVVGILGGLGMFASRLIFGLEKLTERAYRYAVDRQQARQEAALSDLLERLQQDEDPRTQACLTQLEQLYQMLKADIESGKIAVAAHDVLAGVDNVFHLCIEHLERSFDLWKTAQRLTGPACQQILAEREDLIQEVIRTIAHLENTTQQLHSVDNRKKKSELARMREELDETINAARRAEQRADQFGHAGYDPAEFEGENL